MYIYILYTTHRNGMYIWYIYTYIHVVYRHILHNHIVDLLSLGFTKQDIASHEKLELWMTLQVSTSHQLSYNIITTLHHQHFHIMNAANSVVFCNFLRRCAVELFGI